MFCCSTFVLNQRDKVGQVCKNYSVVIRLLSVVIICKRLQTPTILLYLIEKRLTNTQGNSHIAPIAATRSIADSGKMESKNARTIRS